jgi:hypothetical protein
MAKNFGCKKYVLLAEEASGKIFMSLIGAQIPQDLGGDFFIQRSASLAAEEN